MTPPREHLYRMIEEHMRHAIFDSGGQWRTANPEDLTARAMEAIRAGLNPPLDGAAISDAIETIRSAANQGLPIRLDGRGPWYRLTESEPPPKRSTKVLAPPAPVREPVTIPRTPAAMTPTHGMEDVALPGMHDLTA